jgi:hypothetical protein
MNTTAKSSAATSPSNKWPPLRALGLTAGVRKALQNGQANRTQIAEAMKAFWPAPYTPEDRVALERINRVLCEGAAAGTMHKVEPVGTCRMPDGVTYELTTNGKTATTRFAPVAAAALELLASGETTVPKLRSAIHAKYPAMLVAPKSLGKGKDAMWPRLTAMERRGLVEFAGQVRSPGCGPAARVVRWAGAAGPSLAK